MLARAPVILQFFLGCWLEAQFFTAWTSPQNIAASVIVKLPRANGQRDKKEMGARRDREREGGGHNVRSNMPFLPPYLIGPTD